MIRLLGRKWRSLPSTRLLDTQTGIHRPLTVGLMTNVSTTAETRISGDRIERLRRRLSPRRTSGTVTAVRVA